MSNAILSPVTIDDLRAVDSFGTATQHAEDMACHVDLLERCGAILEAAALRAQAGAFMAAKVARAHRPRFFARRALG